MSTILVHDFNVLLLLSPGFEQMHASTDNYPQRSKIALILYYMTRNLEYLSDGISWIKMDARSNWGVYALVSEFLSIPRTVQVYPFIHWVVWEVYEIEVQARARWSQESGQGRRLDVSWEIEVRHLTERVKNSPVF